jgi:anti-sigma factor RsiW
MRELACAEVHEMLPAYADEPGRDLSVRRHLASCESCRTEVARYEEMRRGLTGLAMTSVEPPVDLLPALLAIPDADNAVELVKTHVTRNRKAYVGGAAVLVAGAAGAALWRSRRKLVTA